MSVTENTLARLRSEESFGTVTISTPIVAIFSLLAGTIAPLAIAPIQKLPSYEAIEVSGVSYQACRIVVWGDAEKYSYEPITLLGKRLMALRKQAIAKGTPLLDADEIVEEVRRRRGEVA